jgi:enoyl-CoA hydratase
MEHGNLIVEQDGEIVVITFDRPDVLNALSDALVADLRAALAEVGADPAIRAVVLTGSGTRAFMSGADINELNTLTNAAAAEAKAAATQAMQREIQRLPKPVIAAVNGYALGAGCELAMACDIRIAADTAFFGLPEINLGLIPGGGGTQRLTRLVGAGLAAYYCLTGDRIDAVTAKNIGLVELVVPQPELMNAAKDLAHRLAGKAPLAVAAIKKSINDGAQVDIDRGLAIEAAQFGIACATEDRIEGTKAFLEKRAPQWKGW